MPDEKKFHTDPKPYLKEIFFGEEDTPSVITIKVASWDNDYIETVAKELGLVSDITQAPEIAWAGPIPVQKCCVVGRDAEIVKGRIIEHRRLNIKRQREWRDKDREKEGATKRQKPEDAFAKCKDWDVTWRWKIRCPRLEERIVLLVLLSIFIRKTF